MKTIEINGKTFEVVNAKTKRAQMIIDMATCPVRYNSIYDAYKNPSETKINIWNRWLDWAYSADNETDNCNIQSMVVYGRNSNTFSITFEGTIYQNNDEMFIFGYITAYSNRVVIV